MKHLRVLITAALLIFGAMNVLAGNVKVIVNSSVSASSISVDDLKGVFLSEKSSLSDGSHVVPVLSKGGPTHEAFLRQYLGKTSDTLQTYYRSLVFTGKGSMPKMLGSDAEMVSYVAKTKGAIGYVSADVSADGVKTLDVR